MMAAMIGRPVPRVESAKRVVEAMAIDKLLVWTYRLQKADVVIGLGQGMLREEAELDGVEWQGVSGCGCAAVERIERLGVRVDGGGNYGLTKLHPDAETVHETLMRELERPMQIMVIEHARIDVVPSWSGLLPKAYPVLNGKGKPAVQYSGWDKNRNYGACQVDFVPDIAWIEAVNGIYLAWWEAIEGLALRLRRDGRLVAHEARNPAVQKTPWLGN